MQAEDGEHRGHGRIKRGGAFVSWTDWEDNLPMFPPLMYKIMWRTRKLLTYACILSDPEILMHIFHQSLEIFNYNSLFKQIVHLSSAGCELL